MSTTPPKFEKRNHHFVPQFWLRRFADPKTCRLWKLEDFRALQTGSGTVMAEDWLYTEFDSHWRPSDRVEDLLSRAECSAGKLYDEILPVGCDPTEEQWAGLCFWLGLTACRHPDAMRRGHDRMKELAWALADASSHGDDQSFLRDVKSRFGVSLPGGMRCALADKGPDALISEACAIDDMSVHDNRLPMLDALKGAGEVSTAIAGMDLNLFDAPTGASFVLGDVPVPLTGLSGGFAVPLSSNVAFAAWPSDGSGLSRLCRHKADVATVDMINTDQKARARKVVIGPNKTVLEALSTT